MAELLYRLGRFSSHRAWVVITSWIVALALAVGAFLAFGGTLTTSMSIPGTETEKVTQQLAEKIPGVGGAVATVVFQSEDGEAITAEQQAQIAELMAGIARLDGVDDAIDPFAAASARADQAQQLADGTTQATDAAAQLDAGQTQLDAGQAQLDAATQQLADGQAQLDAAIAQAQAGGAYDQAAAQFAAQQAQLDAGTAQVREQQRTIDEQQTTIDDGRAQLESGDQQLTDGQTLLDAASEIQTVNDEGTVAAGAILFEDDLFAISKDLTADVAQTLDDADIAGIRIDYSAELASSIDGLVGPGEIAGVVLAFLVLIFMFRALLPAVLPLLSSLVSVGIGVAGSMAFSGVIDMSSVTPVLGVMLGLAVGIDYTLFIMYRHRRQLLQGMDVHESIALANGTSGNAVVFAGSTVLVALLALNVTGIPFLGVMGTVGAICILIAVLVAVTLTPAVLGLMGQRVLSRKMRTQVGHDDHANPDLKPMKTGRAVVTAVVAVIALLVIAIPALSMRLGLPDGSSEATDSTQYRTYNVISDEFGAGQNGALIVTAQLPAGVSEDDVTHVQAQFASTLMGVEDVVAVAPAGVSDDRDFFAFQVVPVDGPTTESTEQLVHELRDMSPISTSEGEAEIGVAGQASGNIDISEKLAGVLPIYLALVIGLSLIILIIVFRSLLVPLIATLGFVLSLFAAFGAVTAVYQWGWLSAIFGVHDPGPVLNFAPIIIMGVLFGLAMDYQLFLVSGMREAFVHGAPARVAVVAGLRNGRAVVAAAAIIMTAVFGGFVFSHLAMVRPLGFGLAIGVLFDAFIVRMLLIPALMHLMGDAAWWLPKWLQRILPDVDVEGAALERSHPVHGAAAPASTTA